jgi:diguanylate cyclase (GGDEF)-like protein
MITEPIDVLLIALTDDEAASILDDDGFTATQVGSLDEAAGAPDAGAVVLALEGDGPLEALRRARGLAPNAAIVVVSNDAHAADATVALHAGAEDQLPRDATLATLLPRAVRYAVGMRRVRQELATKDDVTELPNLRGFAAIAEHHVRMADRLNEPVVFVFVRFEDHDRILREEGADAADTLARDAAGVILEAARDSDLPARIAPDTICVLLTGAADGAESLVLSRLVEAIATHDARSDEPRALSLGVGTSRARGRASPTS